MKQVRLGSLWLRIVVNGTLSRFFSAEFDESFWGLWMLGGVCLQVLTACEVRKWFFECCKKDQIVADECWAESETPQKGHPLKEMVIKSLIDYNRFWALYCFPALIQWPIIDKCLCCLIFKIFRTLLGHSCRSALLFSPIQSLVLHPMGCDT